MRRRLLIAWVTGFTVLSATSVTAQSPTAREVIDRAIAAHGGRKLEQVKSRYASGTVKIMGFSGTYEEWAESPNKLRDRIDIGIMAVERAYDGKEGWERRGGNVTLITGHDLTRRKRHALFSPLLAYGRSDISFELEGKESIDGAEAWVVAFTPPGGMPQKFYFDSARYLLVRETRVAPYDDGEHAFTVSYDDYRPVNGVMMPFSMTKATHRQTMTVTIEEYKLNTPIDASAFRNPTLEHAEEPYEIRLSSIPHNVYKLNDGVFEDGPTESWLFYVVVDETLSRPVEPASVEIELCSADEVVKTATLPSASLAAIRNVTFGGLADQKEIFDLRHHFSEPVALGIDRIRYTLTLETPSGETIEETLDVPIGTYEQKTRMIFPIKGRFMIVAGHDFNEPHKQEWSQHYALDAVALGRDYELAKNDGKKNGDFYTWGAEIVAPAAGTVVYARNDVPDNERPGVIDNDIWGTLPDPLYAIPGNCAIIDHGNGEFSAIAHMQLGSVRVRTGDRVEQGQVLGRLGNSGNSDAPHLHYHLQTGGKIFQCDGLPVRFDNVSMDVIDGTSEVTAPRRGLYLVAK